MNDCIVTVFRNLNRAGTYKCVQHEFCTRTCERTCAGGVYVRANVRGWGVRACVCGERAHHFFSVFHVFLSEGRVYGLLEFSHKLESLL